MKQKERHKEEQGSSILKTKNNTENEKKKNKTPKSWFFKMIYKIDKPPPKLDRRREDINYQYQK